MAGLPVTPDLRETLARLDVRSASAEAPDRPALIGGGVRWSFAELARRALGAAARLASSGLPFGTPVAFVAEGRPEVAALFHGLVAAGIPAVPLHPRLTAPERDALMARAGARFFAAHEVEALVAGEATDELRAAAGTPRTADALVGRADVQAPDAPEAVVAGAAPALPPLDPEATLALLFTSGTSGAPKGVLLPRRAFAAGAFASAARLGWRDDDAWLLAMPLGHVGGLSILTRCLIARRPAVLLPRFDANAVLAAIDREGITLLSVVPAMLAALLDADRAGVLARPRAVIVGGAAFPPTLRARALARGVKAVGTYGLTEACAMATLGDPGAIRGEGSGTALPGLEIEVVDHGGRPLPPGEAGSIRIRGPSRMTGYLGEPPLAGPLDTGDLGHLDPDGTLHVLGRRDERIVTGGENVAPAEVEAALERVPGVREALVFGVPDERWGQLVAAALVAEAGLREDEVLAAIARELAPFKRPRLLARVEALPRTPAGKPDRRGAAGRLSALLRPCR